VLTAIVIVFVVLIGLIALASVLAMRDLMRVGGEVYGPTPAELKAQADRERLDMGVMTDEQRAAFRAWRGPMV
jgi:hypothetical protein